MEWLVWLTAICFLIVIIQFSTLYCYSDAPCVWPPCISELIEEHKSFVLVMFGFTCGLIWLNLVIISVIAHSNLLVGLATLMFFGVMGIFAFDVSTARAPHYLFVAIYATASTAYGNLLVSERLFIFTSLLNVAAALFFLLVVITLLEDKWQTRTKYFFTIFECCWIMAFFAYVLAHAFENRFAYNSLLSLQHTEQTPFEEGLHTTIRGLVDDFPPPLVRKSHGFSV
jgi:hypothetical protein